MRNQKGFTLIELLIVVAIIGIIAAIAIPSLLRARVSANESATIGDIRSIISAENTYQSANGGFYGQITCLATPANCLDNYTGPTFLDSNAGQATNNKSGYYRSFEPGDTVAVQAPTVGSGSLSDFGFHATPIQAGRTGVRAFRGDGAGRICFNQTGAIVAGALSAVCNVIQ